MLDTHASTAVIIQFPRRAAPPPLPVQPAPAPRQSLAVAMTALDTALQQQRDAVAAWRDALTDLKRATDALGSGLQRYRNQVNGLAQSIGGLNAEASRMRAWAQAAETGAASAGTSDAG